MTGYSDKSLKDKLGLKEGMSSHFSHAPVEYFEELGLRAARTVEPTKMEFTILFTHFKEKLS